MGYGTGGAGFGNPTFIIFLILILLVFGSGGGFYGDHK